MDEDEPRSSLDRLVFWFGNMKTSSTVSGQVHTHGFSPGCATLFLWKSSNEGVLKRRRSECAVAADDEGLVEEARGPRNDSFMTTVLL